METPLLFVFVCAAILASGDGHSCDRIVKDKKVINNARDGLDWLLDYHTCSFDADGAVEDIKNLLQKEAILEFKGITPCRKCYFHAIPEIRRTGGACHGNVVIAKQCNATTLQVTFSNMTIECDCALPVQPDRLANLFDEAAKTAREAPCSFDSDYGELAKNEHRQSNYYPMYQTPSKLYPLCYPRNSTKSGNARLRVSGSWDNVRVDILFILFNPVTAAKALTSIVDNTDYRNIKSVCPATETGEYACECFAHSRMMTTIIMHFTEKFLPCYINKHVELLKPFWEKFQCK